MSASNSTLEMAAYNAFIAALWRGQLYQYVNIATLTVFVVDYIATLDFEIAYMWPLKFNLVTILFILTRYMPIADLVVMTYTERSMSMTQSLCSHLARSYVWLIYAGMAVAEGLLTLRVWALYGKGRKLTLFMLAVYGGSFAASGVTIYRSLNSVRVTIVDIPGLPRLCATTSYDQLLYLYWVFMIVVDAVSCIMLLVQLVSAYKAGGLTNLMRVVYQDGVIFYLVLLCFSVVNIFSIIMLPADISSLLTAPERIIHAVLAGRVILHTRHQAHEDKLASMITLHTIASFDAARPEQFSHAGGMAGLAFSSGNYTSPQVHVQLTATVGVQVPTPPPIVVRPSPLTTRTTTTPRRPMRQYHGPRALLIVERGASPTVPPLSLSNLGPGGIQLPVSRAPPPPPPPPQPRLRPRPWSGSGGSTNEERPLSMMSAMSVSASAPVCVHRAGGSPVSPTSPAYPYPSSPLSPSSPGYYYPYPTSPTSPTLAASPASPARNPFSSPTSDIVYCASPCSMLPRDSRSTYSCSSASYSLSESVLSGSRGGGDEDVEAEFFEFDAVVGPNASFRRYAQAQEEREQEQERIEDGERIVEEEREPVVELVEGGQGPIFEAALLKQRRRQYARIRRSLRMAQRGAVNASVVAALTPPSSSPTPSAGQNQYHLPSRMMAMSPYPGGGGSIGECENDGTPFRSGWV